MAGTSDRTFRTICHENGSVLGVTELVTARGIRYDPTMRKSLRYLEIDPEREGACAIQLFGYDPEDFTAAVTTVLSHPALGEAAFLDINMGCPVPKVVKTGAGSALMRTPELAGAIIRAAVEAAKSFSVPVGVKFRTGWDERSVNGPDFAKMCVEAGASILCIHGRTRQQMYSGSADWETIARVAEAVAGSGVPVLGNGDVTDGASAVRMLKETGVDGVMVGRAAQGNPWVFGEIRNVMEGGIGDTAPSPEERVRCILRHMEGVRAQLGEVLAVREMRSQLAAYMKGQRNAALYKDKLMRTETIEQVREVLEEWRLESFEGRRDGSASSITLQQ